ncbi:MAG: hypothetical protein HAW59_05885 [Betaproteobacteria bacterium]|nr:hypothetical protein [Betaproteobacteria bacterium]
MTAVGAGNLAAKGGNGGGAAEVIWRRAEMMAWGAAGICRQRTGMAAWIWRRVFFVFKTL